MALPMIAAGVVARAVAKKLASRAAGGITGAGAKSVNKVYKNMGATKSEVKASARALKAANKPLSKGNQKLVTQVKQQTGYIAMDRRPTPPTVAAALKKGPKGSFITEAKKIAMQEIRGMSGPKKISPAQKALNQKLKRGN
jgi:hypothetical protein